MWLYLHLICTVLALVIVFVIVIIAIRGKHSLVDGRANWGDFEQLSWAASPTSLPTTSSQTFLWRSCTIKTLIVLFYWMVLMDAYSCILLCSLEDGYYCIVILSVCHVQLFLMNILRLLQSPLSWQVFHSIAISLIDFLQSAPHEVSVTLVWNNAKNCCRCKKWKLPKSRPRRE